MNAITKLETAFLTTGTATTEGITRRVLVEHGHGGDHYILCLTYEGIQPHITARREDSSKASPILATEAVRWARTLEGVAA